MAGGAAQQVAPRKAVAAGQQAAGQQPPAPKPTVDSSGQLHPSRAAALRAENALRRQPPGDLLPSAHDVRREHRVLKALARTPVPVPNVLALCTDSEVLGVDWMVMEYVAGVAPDDERLPGFTAESRSTAWASAIAVLAHDSLAAACAARHGHSAAGFTRADSARAGGCRQLLYSVGFLLGFATGPSVPGSWQLGVLAALLAVAAAFGGTTAS